MLPTVATITTSVHPPQQRYSQRFTRFDKAGDHWQGPAEGWVLIGLHLAAESSTDLPFLPGISVITRMRLMYSIYENAWPIENLKSNASKFLALPCASQQVNSPVAPSWCPATAQCHHQSSPHAQGIPLNGNGQGHLALDDLPIASTFFLGQQYFHNIIHVIYIYLFN